MEYWVIKTNYGYVKDWRIGKTTPIKKYAQVFRDEIDALRISKNLFQSSPIVKVTQ